MGTWAPFGRDETAGSLKDPQSRPGDLPRSHSHRHSVHHHHLHHNRYHSRIISLRKLGYLMSHSIGKFFFAVENLNLKRTRDKVDSITTSNNLFRCQMPSQLSLVMRKLLQALQTNISVDNVNQ